MSEVIVIGMTGPTGAGKSTVGHILRQKGFSIIDADKTARKVTETGSPTLATLCETFGDDIIDENGALIRSALAAKAFADKESLDKLNAITHPAILALIEKEIATLTESGETKIIIDAPQLFEAGAEKFCTFILSVLADTETRIERITCRDSISRETALARIQAQKPDEFFIENSDMVIYNNSDTDALVPQVDELMAKLGFEVAPQEEITVQTGQVVAAPEQPKRKRNLTPVRITAAIVMVVAIVLALVCWAWSNNYSSAIKKSIALVQNPTVETIESIYPPQIWDMLIRNYSAMDSTFTTAEHIIENYLLDGSKEVHSRMSEDFGEDWSIDYEIISDEALDDDTRNEITADLENALGQPTKVTRAYDVYLTYTIKGPKSETNGYLNFTAVKIDGEWYIAKQYAEIGWKLSVIEF